jgi:hypothetical protein
MVRGSKPHRIVRESLVASLFTVFQGSIIEGQVGGGDDVQGLKHRDGVPAGAVYIGLGSKWGNPFRIGAAPPRLPAMQPGYAIR